MTKTFATESGAKRAARAAGHELDQVDIKQDGARFYYEVNESGAAKHTESVSADMGEVIVSILSADGGDYGSYPEIQAKQKAQEHANDDRVAMLVVTVEGIELYRCEPAELADADDPIELDALESRVPDAHPADVVTVLLALTDAEIASVGPMLAKRFGRPLAVSFLIEGKEGYTIEPPATKVRQPRLVSEGSRGAKRMTDYKQLEPSSKIAKVIALCMREEGATPAELIAATGWDKAPWKWNMTNPQKTGYAERFGLEFIAAKDGKNARYFLRDPEVASAAA